MPHYLVLDALGEFHIVSFVWVPMCIQASCLPLFFILLVPPIWSFCQCLGWSCGTCFPDWSCMEIYLSSLCTWSFSCRMQLLRCHVFAHVGCWFFLCLQSWMFWQFWWSGRLVFVLSCVLFVFLQTQGKNWWHYWCWRVARWDSFRVVCLWATCLFWKTFWRMKISYGSFNTWEFIHIVYVLWCVFGHECFYMVYCSFNCWDREVRISWLLYIWTVQ